MNRLVFIFALLFSLSALAQRIYVYPSTPIAPRGSYQSVTAIVTGVNNKTVTWTSDGGTIVGTDPCVVNEPCTVALYTTTAGTYHLTATSNANNSVSATSTVTFTASPTPATTHPRLLITAAMLPGLRAKATAGNPMYQAIRSSAIAAYNTDNAIWSWTCNSGTGLPSTNQAGNDKEGDAQIFAMMALIDPSDPTYKWGCYGHDLMVYVMTHVINGTQVIHGNDWSDGSLEYVLTPDWLMGSGALSSPGDLTLARQYLYFLAQNVLVTSSTGEGMYGYVAPNGTYNNPSEFTSGDLGSMRMMGNNYTMSRMLYLAAASLTFNDNTTDDPPTSNTCGATRYKVCSDWTAGSLHAYFNYFDGAMLYLDYAHLEDPNVSWQAYQTTYSNIPSQPTCLTFATGISHPCFGDGRGGESSEGSWYQYSLYRLRYAMNLLYTAGYNDPILYGPQMSLPTSSWWDMKYVSDLEFLMGYSGSNVLGGYSYLTTGDTLSSNYARVPNNFVAEAAMESFDSYTGRTDRTNALNWLIVNTAPGGINGTLPCAYDCGFDAGLSNAQGGELAFDLFLSLPATDPVSSPPSDPRPSLPLDLYNGSFNQHQMVRNNWTSNYTVFSHYAPSALIDHEESIDGRFDIFANGEYITKGRTIFTDYNYTMIGATQSNTASYINLGGNQVCTTTGCLYTDSATQGGQWFHEQQQDLMPAPLHSELPAYAAVIDNMTPVYNGWLIWGTPYDGVDYNDLQGASRSTVYLRGTNQVVFYDRGVTGTAADKSVWQVATGPLTIASNVASWPTRSSTQKAYLTNLLPSGAALSNVPLITGSSVQSSDWEPYTTLKVDAGTTTAAQFLNVLEWGASSFTKSTTTLVRSTAKQNFDGALVGNSLVMFMRAWPGTFTGTMFPANGATMVYVSDLIPNTRYAIVGAGAPSTCTTDTAGECVFAAAGTGNITINGTGGLSASPGMAESAAQHFTQYSVPICATCAAVSLLLIGKAAYRDARPEAREERTQSTETNETDK